MLCSFFEPKTPVVEDPVKLRTTICKPHIYKQTSAKTLHLPSESGSNVVRTPIHLDFPRVHVLVDMNCTVVDVAVLLFTLFENFEYEVAADCWVVGIAKVLVDAFLEGLNTLTDFLLVEGVHQFLEYGT